MTLASWLTSAWVGVVLFAATDVDDLLMLSAFFADSTLRPRAIVIGQFAGIGVLTAVSVVAAFLALAIPQGWIALLGLVPLALGIRGAYSLWRSRESGGADDDADELRAAEARAEQSTHSQWMAVAAVTIANGGDNLGVYIPVFSQQPSAIPIYAAVFLVMTAVWCAAGHWLVHHPVLGRRIREYGHVALPFVLIAIGLHILSGPALTSSGVRSAVEIEMPKNAVRAIALPMDVLVWPFELNAERSRMIGSKKHEADDAQRQNLAPHLVVK